MSKTYLPSFKNLVSVSKRATPHRSPSTQESTLAVGFAKSGKRVVSGTNLCFVYHWDLGSGAQYSFRQLVKGKIATSMSFSPNGQLVALAFSPNDVEVYDLDKVGHGIKGGAQPISKFKGPRDTQVSRIAFFPVKSSGADRLICLFSRTTKDSNCESIIRIVDLEVHEGSTLEATVTKRPLEDVTASPDGTYVVARTSQDPLVSFCTGHTSRAFLSRDASSKLPVWEVASKSIVNERDYPFKVSSEPNSQSRKAWRTPSDNASRTTAFSIGHGRRTFFENSEHDFIAVSPPVAGVPRMAAASKSMNIYVWNSETGTLMCILPSLTQHSGDGLVRLAFSRDGTYLVAGFSDGDLAVWDISDKQLLSVAPYSIIPVTFGSKGRQTSSPTPPSSARSGPAKSLRQLYARLNEQAAIALDDLCYATSDGWICDNDGHRLLWVPPEDRHGFWWPRMVSVNETLASKTTLLDFGKFVHGSQWPECRTNRNGKPPCFCSKLLALMAMNSA